jgi:tetratricopeptide (TPR) repeat protein
MAKQRPQPKPKASAHARPSKAPASARRAPAAAAAPAAPAKPVVATSSNPRRPTYENAVAAYEKGLEALQRHDYNKAVALLEGVLTSFPEERELHERVRLYLNVCKRHVTPRAATPQTVQERLYASTLALNGGRYDEAISHLRLVRDEDPDNDHALYMLAVAHAQRGEHTQSIAHLERAIALNPENRALARRDPDLDPLHDDEAFQHALESNGRKRS